MLTISLRGLWSHKRRLVGTFLAVFLGVAFLSGTLVLSDTLRANIDGFLTTANQGTDAVIRNSTSVGTGPATARGLIPQSIVDRVRGVDGVADAVPTVQGEGELVRPDGTAITGKGPRQAGNWVTDSALNPYHLVQGRPPHTAHEVVINRGAAEDGSLRIGENIHVLTPQSVPVRVVGIATFGSQDGFGGSSYTAFSLAGAQEFITKQAGRVSTISVRADPGVSQAELVRRIRPVLPPGAEAISGSQLTSENVASVDTSFLNVFRTLLTVFAGIALAVATFSIHNTFSIIAAQRTRESALLRAIGASRRQILGSVIVEACTVGLLASAAGLVGGLGIAWLLKSAFAGLGFALPAGGLTVTGGTLAVGVPVGVLVTVLAGLGPALKASRVPPLAALRDVGTDGTAVGRSRVVTGLALGAAGLACVAIALSSSASVLTFAGIGGVLLLAAMVVLGPTVARPLVVVLGAPVAALRGMTGQLARQNAMRSPRRTAGAATALMVGIAVVTLFTVFAASVRASIDDNVSKTFAGDLVVDDSTPGGGGNLSPQLATAVAKLPVVSNAAGLGSATVTIDGKSSGVGVADPVALARVLDLGVDAGSVQGLGDHRVAISTKTAADHHWRLGTPLRVGFADGHTDVLPVGALFGNRDIVGGDVLLPRAAWVPHAVQDDDSTVFIALKPGVSIAAGRAAVTTVTSGLGSPTVQDRAQYIDAQAKGVSTLLTLVYVMLVLAIVIALMGIANTTSLSVHERTRELGLLRAVGQTRSQVRAMVRWESVITAVLGTVGGLGLGVFLGWVLVDAAGSEGIGSFAAPAGQLVIVLLVGALAGLLAGLRPARQAARMPTIRAITAE
jgi:putative ABC transport system permease protein